MSNHYQENRHEGVSYKKFEELAGVTKELAKTTGEKVNELFHRTEVLKRWHNEAVDQANDIFDRRAEKMNEVIAAVNKHGTQLRKLQSSNALMTSLLVLGGVTAFGFGACVIADSEDHAKRLNRNDEEILELQHEIAELRKQITKLRVEKKNEMDG